MTNRFFRIFLLLPALVFPAAEAASAPPVSGTKKFCDFNTVSAFLKLRRTREANAVCYYRGTRFVLKLADRQISAPIFGMSVALSEPIVFRNGNPTVSVIDWQKTLRVLLYPQIAKRQRVRSVLLDPGHGGRDRGAAGKMLLEKQTSLRIARRVAALLRAGGIRVAMTRNSDRAVSLADRSKFANELRADLFVSIHLNSASSDVRGIETYCLTPAGAPSSNDRAAKKGNVAACPGNAWDANNLLLAAAVHRKILIRTGAADRGLKRARFAVLRNLASPGILVEAGFLSNKEEERRLASGNYIEIVARAIADGILDYRRTVAPR